MTTNLVETDCYVCGVRGPRLICQRCRENLSKLPKFGYEKPNPPRELERKAA